MKKILIILFFVLLLLTSCASKKEDSKQILATKLKEDSKQILATKLKEDTLKERNKFDKNKTRSKIETLTWFLCFDETIDIPVKVSVNTKNCKQEKWDDFVYFKVKWNSIYKITKAQEELIIKANSKSETSYIWDHIKNDIIYNFGNILEQKYCNYVKLVKKDFLKNETNKEVYIIWAIWLYRSEANTQIEKDPNTLICEWYYPNKKFIIYDINKPTVFLEVKLDNLINLDTLKF